MVKRQPKPTYYNMMLSSKYPKNLSQSQKNMDLKSRISEEMYSQSETAYGSLPKTTLPSTQMLSKANSAFHRNETVATDAERPKTSVGLPAVSAKL